MDLTEPPTALTSRLTIAVLRSLASRRGSATTEQVRRTAGIGTAAGVRRVLEKLIEHGLVTDTGPATRPALYELNRDHVLYPAVQALLAAREALPRLLGESISQWRLIPVNASLFGSAARRDGGLHSDIDLLVIRPTGLAGDEPEWMQQLHDVRGQIHRWTGNHLQVLDRSWSGLVDLVHADEKIVAEWQRDAVTVHGRDLRDLLMELG
ncbi:nucleotidyltransferase domain-containing protein [Phytoactinopolyspora mesophila]|uniref:nucleotidyltransferase domain-containing protein n=1 Tax=Phytoactinopolyspora mesophila TaxID=2650750 RepID=UPI001390EF62|nr:nucleotidyltransferase domain-containing protein [Phytoactinopolyspora mesophila]